MRLHREILKVMLKLLEFVWQLIPITVHYVFFFKDLKCEVDDRTIKLGGFVFLKIGSSWD